MHATNEMQQLFRLLVFLNQPYMIRATNSPILRSTFWLYIQHLVQCTDTAAHRQQCRCIVPKAVYSQKELLRMGEFVARNIWSWFKKTNKRKSCCISLVAYIVVLVMHGHTNINFDLNVSNHANMQIEGQSWPPNYAVMQEFYASLLKPSLTGRQYCTIYVKSRKFS